MQLADELPKDTDPVKMKYGDIQVWGKPDHGFVGDINGKANLDMEANRNFGTLE